MKTSNCDACGCVIGINDMHDGKILTSEYHDEHLHVGSMTITLSKCYKMLDLPPDLCRKCLADKVGKILRKS